ncbi:MAG: hypothetical protein WCB18_09615 [Thermoplasmata archaeon]
MNEMFVRTSQQFPSPASKVWTLLCNSRMDGTPVVWFRFGVPQPVECRLPDGQGGVGSERECISDQGVVHQRIIGWIPEKRLSFRMEKTDLRFQRYVREIVDTFDLVSTDAGVWVTRTTGVWTKGRFQSLKMIALHISLKQVHRYVFRNWLRLAKIEHSSTSLLEAGSPATPTP